MKESYDWILRAIESCNNDFHLRCCRTLIDLFDQQYGSSGDHVILSIELSNRCTAKEAMLMI